MELAVCTSITIIVSSAFRFALGSIPSSKLLTAAIDWSDPLALSPAAVLSATAADAGVVASSLVSLGASGMVSKWISLYTGTAVSAPWTLQTLFVVAANAFGGICEFVHTAYLHSAKGYMQWALHLSVGLGGGGGGGHGVNGHSPRLHAGTGMVVKHAGGVRKSFAVIAGLCISGFVAAAARGAMPETAVTGSLVIVGIACYLHATNPDLFGLRKVVKLE